ncbi:Protein phosphatase 2C 2 [Rhizophlyctis rosea]|uniref:protein-serine/threonine phosphatase n=1 Tax=Rhizophlyctis rosea TaxID=64517 RepID=A0AAD5SP94_9FUNG|nr:Protein phosphatase 2C 2 [Rhizophlyctis rosea]
MGQTLSEPATDKHTDEGQDERLAYGSSAMQGWRISMEDAHTTLLNLALLDSTTPNATPPPGSKHLSFFAVYDGHGGQSVAKYSGAQLHRKVMADENFSKGDYALAIKYGFLKCDQDLRGDPSYANDPSGCTAVAALITDDWRILVGNAGDSRAVLSNNGIAVPLSYDHKPVNPEEHSRITTAGGFVEFGRVNGNLALSRAIGDFEFKNNSNLPPEQQIVTANPDIIERQLGDGDEFVVIACDGIWDCMSNQEVVDFVRQRVAQDIPLGTICEQMMDKCLAPDSEVGGVGCDNMTVVIVGLLRGKKREGWVREIREKVGREDGGEEAVAAKVEAKKDEEAKPAGGAVEEGDAVPSKVESA